MKATVRLSGQFRFHGRKNYKPRQYPSNGAPTTRVRGCGGLTPMPGASSLKEFVAEEAK